MSSRAAADASTIAPIAARLDDMLCEHGIRLGSSVVVDLVSSQWPVLEERVGSRLIDELSYEERAEADRLADDPQAMQAFLAAHLPDAGDVANGLAAELLESLVEWALANRVALVALTV